MMQKYTAPEKERKKQNKKFQNNGISDGGQTRYTGPIILKGSKTSERTEKMNTSVLYTLAANGSGIMDLVYASGDVTSITDWASLALVWHEYRVLGMKLTFAPTETKTTTTAYPPHVSVVDRDNATLLGGYAAASTHDSVKLHQTWAKGYGVSCKMNGPEESVWTPVGTTFSSMWIKTYSQGYSASQVIGLALLTFCLEFRNRG